MNEPSYLRTEFVEFDTTGRYGRYTEVLGRGASKIVYKAFDEYEGIEVAWNQVKVHDALRSAEGLQRLYSEIHILKTLNHKNIMKYYTSWIDPNKRNVNFVTELFTSGTLRQYRLKHKRVNIRAVKNWCRQILKGLVYLHSQDPPVIHRDLKCDNIFVNGNQGEVKIGDLGLAEILKKSHADHCVGTPEFMAPEIYEEAYNELADIYSFGMCVLEMITSDYPYSECSSPAHIYKKVTSGVKPLAFYKVTDAEVQRFVERCLVNVSERPSAQELLEDPFLMIDEPDPLDSLQCETPQPAEDHSYPDGIELFDDDDDDEELGDSGITIKGKRRDDGNVFLKLRTVAENGQVRNIYFPFVLEADTSLSVATEMVADLDMADEDVFKIAEMIEGEIASLVPSWEGEMCLSDDVEEVGPVKEDDVEVDVQQRLRWLRAMYQMEVRKLREQQVDGSPNGRFTEVPPLRCNNAQRLACSLYRTASLPVDAVHL